MVSAQVSSTSENLYGSAPHLLHQFWLLLGCWFCSEYFFFIACSNYLTPQIQSTYLGEQLNPLTKLHEGYTLHSSAVLHRGFGTPAPGTAQKQLILRQFYSPVRHVLWQCSSQTIAINHLFLLIQILVLLHGWSEKQLQHQIILWLTRKEIWTKQVFL